MPEWLMGEDCKSSGFAYAGSNPARPKTKLANRVLKFASLIDCVSRKFSISNKKTTLKVCFYWINFIVLDLQSLHKELKEKMLG